MNSIIVVLAFVAVANAGGIANYAIAEDGLDRSIRISRGPILGSPIGYAEPLGLGLGSKGLGLGLIGGGLGYSGLGLGSKSVVVSEPIISRGWGLNSGIGLAEPTILSSGLGVKGLGLGVNTLGLNSGIGLAEPTILSSGLGLKGLGVNTLGLNGGWGVNNLGLGWGKGLAIAEPTIIRSQPIISSSVVVRRSEPIIKTIGVSTLGLGGKGLGLGLGGIGLGGIGLGGIGYAEPTVLSSPLVLGGKGLIGSPLGLGWK